MLSLFPAFEWPAGETPAKQIKMRCTKIAGVFFCLSYSNLSAVRKKKHKQNQKETAQTGISGQSSKRDAVFFVHKQTFRVADCRFASRLQQNGRKVKIFHPKSQTVRKSSFTSLNTKSPLVIRTLSTCKISRTSPELDDVEPEPRPGSDSSLVATRHLSQTLRPFGLFFDNFYLSGWERRRWRPRQRS